MIKRKNTKGRGNNNVCMKLLSYTDVYFYESEMKIDIQICIFTTIAST